jgi:hypothetical protein
VDESSKPHKLKNEEKIKIILAGLKEEMPDVRRVIIRGKVIDDGCVGSLGPVWKNRSSLKIKTR